MTEEEKNAELERCKDKYIVKKADNDEEIKFVNKCHHIYSDILKKKSNVKNNSSN